MKYNNARTGLAIVFALGLIATLAPPTYASDRDRTCSLEGAAGNWAFTDNGTVIGVGPRTAVGTFTLDSSGNLRNGVATSSLNGSVAIETFSGTYAVNPDCTGTLSVDIFSSGTKILTVTVNLAFDDSMKELRAIFTSATLPNGTALSTVIALDARRQ